MSKIINILKFLILIIFFYVFINEFTQLFLKTNVFDYMIYDLNINNKVTSIYLNIRIFDTLFEVLLLFASVGGVWFLFRKDEDVL